MTIQEAFECMQKGIEVQTLSTKGPIEKIEKHPFMEGNISFVVNGTHCEVGCLSKIKPKKRYWLWDVKGIFGTKKDPTYMDENGFTDSKIHFVHKDKLIKKHENEFIDVEVE